MRMSFYSDGKRYLKGCVIAILLGFIAAVTAFAAPTISAINDQTIDEDANLTVTFSVGSGGSTGGGGGFPFPFLSSAANSNLEAASDDAPITVTVTVSNHILLPDAGIDLVKSGSNYTLTLTPAADQSGQATVYISADDGSYSTQETFAMIVQAVNDAPVAHIPENQEMDEDAVLIFEDNNNMLTVSDVDAGSNTVQATVGVLHGTLSIPNGGGTLIIGNGAPDLTISGTISQINDLLDGLEYHPEPDWNGDDELTLTIDDKGNTGKGTGTGNSSPFPFPLPGGGGGDNSNSDADTLTITVLPVSDPLSLDLPSEIPAIEEDSALAFDPESGPFIRIVDGDGPFGDFEVAFQMNGPAVLYIPEDGYVIADYEGPDDLLLQGTLPRINAALSGLLIEPEINWNGELTLSITATDLTSSDSDTENGELSILVKPVNDAPVFGEDAQLTLSPVEMNDSDPTGDKVADLINGLSTDADDSAEMPGMAVVGADSANGIWEFSSDGGVNWTSFDENIGIDNALLLVPETKVRFIPATDWSGSAAMEFRIWDKTGDTLDTTENGGATSFSSAIGVATVSVTEGSTGPILAADAGDDMNAAEEDTVFLDGSGSQISDELEVLIAWTQLSGAPVTLENAGTLQPNFRAPRVGAEGEELEFELSISDNLDRTRSAKVIVRINNRDQIRADAGPDRVVLEDETVTLNAAESFIPDEIQIAPMYTWEQTSGTAVDLSTPTAEETTFTAPELGDADSLDLEFTLTITDNGGQSDSDSVKITVTRANANQPPSANAGSNRTVAGGTTVTLDGSGSSDPDGFIVAYNWESITDNTVVLATPGDAATSFTAPAGDDQDTDLQFKLTVTDNSGISTSDTVTITVLADDNVIPPGPGQGNKISLSVEEGRTGSLEAGNFEVGSQYSWTQTSGSPQVTLSDSNSPSPTFVGPSVDAEGTTTLGFELMVDTPGGNRYYQDYEVAIEDNGIVGFPSGLLTFRLFNGSSMGIKVTGNGSLVTLESIDPAEITDTRKRPKALPYGLIDMAVKVDEPGQTVTVTVYPKSPTSPQNKWYKYSEEDGWVDYSEYSHINPSGTEITVFLADGGAGDVDKIANGMIVDPAGPGLPPSAASSSGSGDEDGCFIQTMSFDIF